jgi:FPC/CPF motif-containing protein YcgG
MGVEKNTTNADAGSIIKAFQSFILDESYPCVAARAATRRENIHCLVVGHMGCARDDRKILQFIYDFVNIFRHSEKPWQSAAIIFQGPEETTSESFDRLLWERLQTLADLDAENFGSDKRVSADPAASNFSYSLGEEAFFIIGLHPGSGRRARRFVRPTIIFNPHVQFEDIRKLNRYEKLKNVVRERDIRHSGSINPMLADFGTASEAFQYSGREHDKTWVCPLHNRHAEPPDHPTEK